MTYTYPMVKHEDDGSLFTDMIYLAAFGPVEPLVRNYINLLRNHNYFRK